MEWHASMEREDGQKGFSAGRLGLLAYCCVDGHTLFAPSTYGADGKQQRKQVFPLAT